MAPKNVSGHLQRTILSLFPRSVESALGRDRDRWAVTWEGSGTSSGGGVARQAAQSLREGSWSQALPRAELGCERTQMRVPPPQGQNRLPVAPVRGIQ